MSPEKYSPPQAGEIDWRLPQSIEELLNSQLQQIAAVYTSDHPSDSGRIARGIELYNPIDRTTTSGAHIQHWPEVAPSGAITRDCNAVQKIEGLQTVYEAIHSQTIATYQEKGDSFEARHVWENLLTSALAIPESDTRLSLTRDARLASAVLLSMISGTTNERLALIEAVEQLGASEDVENACLILDATLLDSELYTSDSSSGEETAIYRGYPLSTFARAFKVDPAERNRYLGLTLFRETMSGQSGEITPGAARRELERNLNGETARMHAALASGHGDKVDGPITDIYKVERFYLRQRFIQDQLVMLLGEDLDDLMNSPFARALRQKLHELRYDDGVTTEKRIEQTCFQFSRFVEDVFIELSEQVVERYIVENASLDNTLLTPEQRAQRRHVELVARAEQDRALMLYLEPWRCANDPHVPLAFSTANIWDSSIDGGATGRSIDELFYSVLEGADRLREEGGVILTPEELYAHLQTHRFLLRSAARHNIQELPSEETIVEANVHTENAASRRARAIQLITNIAAKGSLDHYWGVTINCPAVEVKHPARRGLTPEQRYTFGSANLIDHILAIAITEAYRHGMLDITCYAGSEQK